ncbi:MAG: SsrA-binding protein SmpB [Kiritimatiellaeota bacterium]|nr:SsrA-binding protein SmpB [Kiritimatiellota bacterium]
MTSTSSATPAGIKVIAQNRKAHHDYHVLEKIEAGLALRGPEVKSIRAGTVSLGESYAIVEQGQVILRDLHINPYPCARLELCDPVRPKVALLHRREIKRLADQIAQQGRTLIPLRLYLKNGLVKLELAICSGKHADDKRETLRRKTAEREAARAIADRTRR